MPFMAALNTDRAKDGLSFDNRNRPDAILGSVLAFEMIYDFINDFQVDLFERPKRLGNLAFSIHLDQYLPLARSGFWCRKELNQKRNVTSRSLLEQKSGLAKAPIYVESI